VIHVSSVDHSNKRYPNGVNGLYKYFPLVEIFDTSNLSIQLRSICTNTNPKYMTSSDLTIFIPHTNVCHFSDLLGVLFISWRGGEGEIIV
jgi:hypothetical protein